MSGAISEAIALEGGSIALEGPGYVDLHSHYVPAIDDGVRTLEDAVALLAGLRELGFEAAVATPHIKPGHFDNRGPGLRAAHARLREDVEDAGVPLPVLGLAAEHWLDDVVFGLIQRDEAVRYPGQKALLFELPREQLPHNLGQVIFQMRLKGIRPVLAHPERYRPFFKDSAALEGFVSQGAAPLLDVMSLSGRYGRKPRKAAERILDEGLYAAACSDLHKPKDLPYVAEGMAKLDKRVGAAEMHALFSARPRRLLADGLADW
ncbi:MAG: CpsB/CapC family capsule biosynthesis tyrosine phosphatase [Myxococcota bacterium]